MSRATLAPGVGQWRGSQYFSPSTPAPPDDPHAWLEDVEGEKALAWVRERNAACVAAVGDRVNRWQVRPSGTEGYRTAEVTLGGVDVSGLSAQTMEATKQPGLYFIGEVVDVTGHLGGYNFQWAWSSGFVAGEAA